MLPAQEALDTASLGEKAQGLIGAMDANGDNTVSREEFQAHMAAFNDVSRQP